MPGRPQRSLEQHRAIVEAIRSGNPLAARQALTAHLRSIEEELDQYAGDATPNLSEQSTTPGTT